MKIIPKVASPTGQSVASWLFKPVERPSFADTLTFPEEITKLSSGQVSEVHCHYTALYAYAIAELSKKDIESLKYRSEHMVRKNNIARTGYTYSKKKHAIDIDTRLDKGMENIELASHRIEAEQIQLKAYVEIFDRYISALSRELTRRSAEVKRI